MFIIPLLVSFVAQERPFDFMTREVFDALIFAVIMIGLALAVVRLYRDFTRPLPENEDTKPNQAINYSEQTETEV